MKYQEEQTQKKIKNTFGSFKIIIKKLLSVIIAVVLIITIVISINFFRSVVIGKSTMSEFKSNFFGLPTDKLLQINQEMKSQYNSLKEWLNNFWLRLSS